MMADEFQLTQDHIALLREVVISWDITEVGAPTVEPAVPYGSRDLLDDVARVLGITPDDQGEYSAVDRERIWSLHRDLETTLAIMIGAGEIEPGHYEFQDKVAYLDAIGQLSYSTTDIRKEDSDESEEIEFSDNKIVRFFQIIKMVLDVKKQVGTAMEAGIPQSQFRLTPEHLKLLASMSIRWEENDEPPIVVADEEVADQIREWLEEENLYPVAGFDPKRPYGAMTYHFLDMAEILGVEPEGPETLERHREEVTDERLDFSEAQKDRFTVLHREMQTAVQVVVQHASLEPGHYQLDEDSYEWVRTDPSAAER